MKTRPLRARVSTRDLSETVQGSPENLPIWPAALVDALKLTLDDQLTRRDDVSRVDYAQITGEGRPGVAVAYVSAYNSNFLKIFGTEPILIDDGGSQYAGKDVLKVIFRPGNKDENYIQDVIRKLAENVVPGGLAEPVTPAKECIVPGTQIYAFRRE